MLSLLRMLLWRGICTYYRLVNRLSQVEWIPLFNIFISFSSAWTFLINIIFLKIYCGSCAVELMKMQWVPVLSLSLHLLMNRLLMMLLCYHLVFMSYHWIPKQLSDVSNLTNITVFLVSIYCGHIWSLLLVSLLQDGPTANRTLDLASTLEVGPSGSRPVNEADGNSYNLRSVLTIAFQFTFENHLRDNVAAMARQYVRSVVSSVQRVAMAIAPSRLSSQMVPKPLPGSPEAHTLARWICRSYRCDKSLNFCVFFMFNYWSFISALYFISCVVHQRRQFYSTCQK